VEKRQRNKQTDVYSIDAQRILSNPSVIVDYEYFAHFLSQYDISEEEEREYMQLVWNIMFEIISLGFEVHPLQNMEGKCGQFGEKEQIPGCHVPENDKLEKNNP
jgi:hypothetical protein